jgi:hypothetical protein
VQIVQAFKPDDKPCRFQFAKDILSNVVADENYFGDGYSVMKQRFAYEGG